jgi:hypothetical protein
MKTLDTVMMKIRLRHPDMDKELLQCLKTSMEGHRGLKQTAKQGLMLVCGMIATLESIRKTLHDIAF